MISVILDNTEAGLSSDELIKSYPMLQHADIAAALACAAELSEERVTSLTHAGMTLFKVDENLPGEVAEQLKTAGHDAMSVHYQKMVGATDGSLPRRRPSDHHA